MVIGPRAERARNTTAPPNALDWCGPSDKSGPKYIHASFCRWTRGGCRDEAEKDAE